MVDPSLLSVEVSQSQLAALTSEARETFFIGGVGSGKTFFLALQILTASQTRGAVLGLFAPTRNVLKKATLRQIEDALNNKLGVHRARDYVVNRMPPARWGVPAYSSQNNNSILTFRWGSYVLLDGLDNPDSQRGTQLDEIFVDEFRDVKQGTRDVLIGRLRGQAYKDMGKKHRIWYATTPPDNVSFLRTLSEKQDENLKMIFASTMENEANLPDGYIDSLRMRYDDVAYQREVLGQLVDMRNRPFVYAFDQDVHVKPVKYNPKIPLVLAFDFNINPATCIAVQAWGDRISVIKEWRMENTELPTLVRKIKAEFPTMNVQVTGDASGNNRDHRNGTVTSYILIQQILGISKQQLQVPRKNPDIVSSRNMCNFAFSRMDISVDPSCKWLIEDLLFVQANDDGKMDKSDASRTHLLDCLRYYLFTYHANKMVKQ